MRVQHNAMRAWCFRRQTLRCYIRPRVLVFLIIEFPPYIEQCLISQSFDTRPVQSRLCLSLERRFWRNRDADWQARNGSARCPPCPIVISSLPSRRHILSLSIVTFFRCLLSIC